MPEIAEAARIVHFLRNHLVGKRIKKVKAIDDSSVFGKVGTTGDAFASSVAGKVVISAGSQGKYFWLVLDSPPHPVMHFGMTGWIHIRGQRTGYTNYYNKMKPGEADLWPPKYWKFLLETEGYPKVEVAFTDPRRFGRVRLVDCPGDSIRKASPLVENGPDPVVDADIFTEQFVLATMRKRHVPIKALLLDQTFISGIGNWVGDEVLYHARLHPEQYCDDFSDAEITRLYNSICHVCRTAVDLLGDSDKFPEDWLFHYRWGKGSKDAATQLPSGEKLEFLTVGGRTSCYAPNLQKKTSKVVPAVKEESIAINKGKAPQISIPTRSRTEKDVPKEAPETKKSKAAAAAVAGDMPPKATKRKRAVKKEVEKEVEVGAAPAEAPPPKAARRGKARTTREMPTRAKAAEKAAPAATTTDERRRSARFRAKK